MEYHALASVRNVRKQPMFNGIVLWAVRRIVRNADFQIKQVGEFLQSLLEDMSITGVAAATITKQQQLPGIGIMLATMQYPPMRNTVTTKLTCIRAGIEVHIAFVPRHVIDAMWNQFAFTEKICSAIWDKIKS